jgi:hypothetical protein
LVEGGPDRSELGGIGSKRPSPKRGRLSGSAFVIGWIRPARCPVQGGLQRPVLFPKEQEFSRRLAACLNVGRFTRQTVSCRNPRRPLVVKEPGVPCETVAPVVSRLPTTVLLATRAAIPPSPKGDGILADFYEANDRLQPGDCGAGKGRLRWLSDPPGMIRDPTADRRGSDVRGGSGRGLPRGTARPRSRASNTPRRRPGESWRGRAGV